MADVKYDPAMVEWMRENKEPCALTKPELAKLFEAPDAKLESKLSENQVEAIALKIAESVEAETSKEA